MATHSNILAWEIPWTEESNGLHPWGCNESDRAQRLSRHACTVYLVPLYPQYCICGFNHLRIVQYYSIYYWKNPPVIGSAQFKFMLFKGQLYIFYFYIFSFFILLFPEHKCHRADIMVCSLVFPYLKMVPYPGDPVKNVLCIHT